MMRSHPSTPFGPRSSFSVLGIMIIGMVIVVLYMRRIIAPIRALSQAADRLAAGDVDVQVACHSTR